MNIENTKDCTIYRNDYNGNPLYSIGLSHKKQDGTWENGYMNCKFPKGTDLLNKTRIKIHSAWIDFYLKDKTTHPYIFINKYEVVQINQDEELLADIPQSTKTDYQTENSDIQITDADLPF